MIAILLLQKAEEKREREKRHKMKERRGGKGNKTIYWLINRLFFF